MPKFNFGLDTSLADAEIGESFYVGETPPKGIYSCIVKMFKIAKNKNDDRMLKVLLEVQEKGNKGKYNGYGIWQNLNVTDQGAPYINNYLDALGVKREAFWGGQVVVDEETAPNVMKIGVKKVVGVKVRVATKMGTWNNDTRLEVVRYLVGDEGVSEPDDDDDEDNSGLADEEASVGLDDDEQPDADAEDAEEEEEAADAEDAPDFEPYTKEDLDSLEPSDLRSILTDWSVEFAEKATKPTLIKLVMKAQEEEPAEAEDDEDVYTEEDLTDLSPADLKGIYAAKGWDLPAPPVKSKLVKGILLAQAQPPF